MLCLLLASGAFAQMATGTYTGDGGNWRTINGVGFEPDVVIVKADENMPAIIRTSEMPIWQSKQMAWNFDLQFSRITEFGADSFTISNSEEVNRSGWRYDWTAFEADPERMIVGSYVGDDTYDRRIATGFSPQYVIVIPEDISQSVQRSKDMPDDFTLPFDDEAELSNYILTCGPSGFRIGDNVNINDLGITYYYIAWADAAPYLQTGTYVGNENDNRNIATPGLHASMFLTKANSGEDGIFTTASLAGTGESLYFDQKNNDPNRVQSLDGEGFQLGNDKDVNESGKDYYWAAFGIVADLEVTQSVDRDTALVGETVTYTVNLTNLGPGRAQSVEVTDLLPSGLNHISSSATSGNYEPSTGVWSVTVLDAGMTATLTIDAMVQAGTAGQTLVNTSAVTDFLDNDPVSANDSASTSLTIPQTANVGVSGLTYNPNPNPEQIVSIQVGMQNLGPDAATNAVVDLPLPAGLEYVSHGEGAGSYDPLTERWTVATLGVLNIATLYMDVRVLEGTAGQTLSIPLSITSDSPDSDLSDNTDSIDFTVPGTDLELAMSVDQPSPSQGDTITFDLTVYNAGPEPAYDIEILDVIPTGLAFVAAIPSQGNYASGVGKWMVGDLVDGATATLAVSLLVDGGQAGAIINQATISEMTPADSDPSDNQAEVTIAVQGVDVALGLGVDDDRPNVGDRVSFTLTATNLGDVDASGLVISDNLPVGLDFVSATPSQGGYTPGTGAWDVGSLDAGANATLVLEVDVAPGSGGQTFIKSASVTSLDQIDGDADNDQAEAVLTVQAADLRIIKSVDNPSPAQGEQVAFTLTLINEGPDPAMGVAVVDTLPVGLVYQGSVPDQGFYDSGTHLWDVGVVAAGDTLQLVMDVEVQVDLGAAGNVLNTASILAANQEDPDPSTNSASVALSLQSADLHLTLGVDDATPLVGDTIRFSLTLLNEGPVAAHGITVRDTLPSGLSYVGHDPAGPAYDSVTGLWSAGDLNMGESVVLNIDATVDAGLSGSTLINAAQVTFTDQADPDGTDNYAFVAVDVRTADLSLDWWIENTTPTVLDTVALRLDLDNAGPSDLDAADLELRIPAGLTPLDVVPSHGSYDAPSGLWTVTSLASGQSAWLDIQVEVAAGTIGQMLDVEAEVLSATPEDPTPNPAIVTASLNIRGADLVLSQTANVSEADLGETIFYTLTVRNDGPDDAVNVLVQDLLPPELAYESHTPAWSAYDTSDGVWNVGGLGVDASGVLLIRARVLSAVPGDTIVNTAVVQGAAPADPDLVNNMASVSVNVPAADLGLDLLATTLTPAMGQEVVFSLTVANAGPYDATGTVASLALPEGLVYVASSAPSYDPVTGRWVLGDLDAGQEKLLELTALVDSGTADSILDVVGYVLEADQGDPLTDDNTSVVSLTIQSDADLALMLQVSQTVADVGDTLSWNVMLTNLGPTTATGVAVRDSLPATLSLLNTLTDDGAYDPALATWDIGTIAAGDTVNLNLESVVEAGFGGSDLYGEVRIQHSDVADLNSANNLAAQWLHVTGADLALTSYVDRESLQEGDDLNITLAVTNLGPDPAFGVTVRDTLPEGLEYVSHTPPEESYELDADGTWIWNVDTVEGTSPRVLFVRTQAAFGTAGQQLSHGALTIPGDQEDANTDNNAAANLVTVMGADLELTATVDDATPAEGDTLSLRTVLRNHGPLAATGIVVEDTADMGLSLLETTAEGSYEAGVWTVPSLAAGDSLELLQTYRVEWRSGGSTQTLSSAITTLDQVDPLVANNESYLAVAVDAATEGLVLLSAYAVPDSIVRPLGVSVDVLGLELVNWTLAADTLETIVLNNVSVGAGNAADLDGDWHAVELWREDAGAWTLLPGDPVSFVGGEARFENLSQVLTPGDTLRLAVRGRASTAAADGDRLGVAVPETGAFTFRRPVEIQALWPILSDAEVLVDGFVTAQATVHEVPTGVVAPGELGRLVLDVTLPANGYLSNNLNDLQVVNLGTAVAGTEIGEVRLWADADEYDGVLVPLEDEDLGVMAWTGDRWRLSGLEIPISVQGQRFFVTVNTMASATGERSLQFAVPVDGVLYDDESDGPLDEALVNPYTQQLSDSERLYLAAVARPWRSVRTDGSEELLLHLTATNTYPDARTLTSLRLSADSESPYTIDQDVLDAVVGQLVLREDINGDGVPGTDDTFLGAASLNEGAASFSGLAWTVPASTTRHLFVNARLSVDSAADGDNVAVVVANAVDVQLDADSEISGAWPLDGGGGLVVDGLLADRVDVAPLGSRMSAPGDEDVQAFSLVLPTNGHADDVLNSLTVINTGTATGDEIEALTLWDAGVNGEYDAGAVDDISLGELVPRFDAWTADDLNLDVYGEGRRVFVGLDIAPSAADSATVNLAIPLGGLNYASDNDGPLDRTVEAGGSVLITTSALLMSLDVTPEEVVVGQPVSLSVRVTNTATETLTDVLPLPLIFTGDGGMAITSGPVPATDDLISGESVEFQWTLTATGVGSCSMTCEVSGSRGGAPVTSLPISSPLVKVSAPAPELSLAALSQLPFAVNGGQTDVNALTLDLTHPGDATASSVRIDSLVVRLEDSEGQPVDAGGVLASVQVRADGILLSSLSVDSGAGSSFRLVPENAPIIAPSHQSVLSVGIALASTAAGAEFRLVLDEDGLAAHDAVAGGLVGLELVEGEFPVRSELTQVVDGALGLNVMAGALGDDVASRGQHGVVLGGFEAVNPGVADLGAGVQLGVVEVALTDASELVIENPAAVIEGIGIWSEGLRVAWLDQPDSSTSEISIPLDTPLPVEAGHPVLLEIRCDLREDAPLGLLGMNIADGEGWDARDANSGVPVPVGLSPQPLTAATVQVFEPASLAHLGGAATGVPVLTGGAQGQKLMRLSLRHPGGTATAAVTIDTLVLHCEDASSAPLAAVAVFDRFDVMLGDAVVGSVAAPLSADGKIVIPLFGVNCGSGGTLDLDVAVDIRNQAMVDSFALRTDIIDLQVVDANLSTPILVTPDVGAVMPLSSGLRTVRIAADEMQVAALDRMPAVLSAVVAETPALDLMLTNTAEGSAGDLLITGLDLRGLTGDKSASAFGGTITEILVYHEDRLWGRTDILEPGDSLAVVVAEEGLRINPGRTERLSVMLALSAEQETGSVALGLTLDDLKVQQPEGDLVTVRTLPVAGMVFPFWTAVGTLSPASLADSYSNFPNPFAAGREVSTFVFALDRPAAVTLTLYSARGEHVCTLVDREHRASGLYQQDVWDGRNGRGDVVRNGVYIAEIIVEYEDGERSQLRRKTAVVR